MNSSNSTPMIARNCAEVRSRAKILAHGSSPASSSDLLIQNHLNFKRSSCPKRIMFYESGSWADYSEDVADVMKSGFMEGKAMVEAQVVGLNSLYDFYRMLEIDLGSGNQRSIAWIDVDGKCFFPKTFVDSFDNEQEADLVNCNENCTKIEIEVKIKDSSVEINEKLGNSNCLEVNKDVKLSKRKRDENVENEEMAESLCSFNAKKRQVVESDLQSSRWPKARVMAVEEKGYAIVEKLLLTGLEMVKLGAVVTAIHQCVRTGPLDKVRTELFTRQMEITKRIRGKSNVIFAWYGTSAEGVESILMNGFGLPSKSPPEDHGIGIHLSPIRSPENSAMSSEMDENGEKHVILCRVILGKCEKVEVGSHQLHPSSVEYDTGVDDLNNPRQYTVWHCNMNTHIIPECVVSYKPVNIKGSVNGVSRNGLPAPVVVAQLFSSLRKYLPPPRFQEVQSLWQSCKEGKLGRDAFMRILRSVVGDDVLRSTIQDIRG